ncbi:MAG: aldo/keto reductase [Oscillospiraceae bacterium]|nr:aldo/keto reductase [Oscillospiraceae bacterium]
MKKFGFGLMRLPLNSSDHTDIDMNKTTEMIDAFIAAGGTYFDTAYPYHGGKSEIAFREAVVKRYPRESFTVTDKLPIFSISRKEQMEEIFSEQLERCGVDFFDYYWVHSLGTENYKTAERIDAFGFISRKKAEGKIKHIGFSFHDSPDVLEQILNDHPETEYVQLQINYLDWEDKGVQARRCYEVAIAHKTPIIIMEPIKGGALASVPEKAEAILKEAEPDMSTASWAMRFAASLEGVLTVLSGMSTIEQVKDNVSYMMELKPLTERENEAVMKCAEIIRSNIAIPCTACRYCTDECPKDIPIPDYFTVYNDKERYAIQHWEAENKYKKISDGHGKASECISCGKCENHCPQHLPVRDYLKKIAAQLERR